LGRFEDAAGVLHGFIKTGNTYTVLTDPNASGSNPDGVSGTLPSGINNEGTVVGMYVAGGHGGHSFIWRNGTFSDFSFPGSSHTELNAINDVGDLAGLYVDASGDVHGFEALVKFLPADFNRDGVVNFADLLILAQHYGINAGATMAEGDADADGAVNFGDLLIMAQEYGQGSRTATAVPVPEPSSLAGLLTGPLMLGRRRR
jgi:probable HAF family extracellular repeat protein